MPVSASEAAAAIVCAARRSPPPCTGRGSRWTTIRTRWSETLTATKNFWWLGIYSRPVALRQDAIGESGDGQGGSSSGSVDGCFAVDSERVVYETIDDETILIHLETGTYYSLTGTGAEIWELLSTGCSLRAAEETLLRRYPADAARVRPELTRIADELTQEELLRPAAPASVSPAITDPPPRRFEPPVLQRYTDMEYFLRLDPIHEVDGSLGWPEAPASSGRS
jgi:Coenzyme PQQ synthesis protein D (PqqD)